MTSRWRPGVMCAALLALLVSVTLTGANARVHVLDLDGRHVDPLAASAGARAVVLLFVSIECPISNRYAPEVSRLHEQLTARGVRYWLVYPNPLESPARIREHLRAFGLRTQALRDPKQELAKQAGVTITPEAAVYDARGRRVYRGRIDNRYVALGRNRPGPTRRDLYEALTATLTGRIVEQPETQAVGCFIADFSHAH